MTAMASAAMLTTRMSFPMVVLMVRTLHIRIIIKRIIDKSFYLSKVMDGMYNIVNDPEIFILETA